MLPTLRSKPCLVVGTPIFLETFCRRAVSPTALFSENDTPGMRIIIQFLTLTLQNYDFLLVLHKFFLVHFWFFLAQFLCR